MTDIVRNGLTTLSADEVVSKAVQFFATMSWRPTSQSAHTATFEGRLPIPWLHMAGTILGFILCIVPGVIMYFLLIKKVRAFQNLVVSTATTPEGTSVVVRCPPRTAKLAERFLATLPGTTPTATDGIPV